jgi:GWxTD domain-containing protein
MRHVFFPSLALLCSVATAHAQRAEPVFRDSFADVTDTVALRLAASLDSRDAASLLTKGFAGLRLFALTRRPADADRARDAFDDAAHLEPGNASAWYGLGLSWALAAERQQRNPPRIVTGEAIAEALGNDAASRAIRAFRHALELEPNFLPAAEALVPLAIAKRSHAALEQARASLAAAEREGRFQLGALLALARVQAALGNREAAASAARRAANLAGQHDTITAIANYQLATSLFLSGQDSDGARTWFAAIDDLTPELAGLVYDELRTIADDQEKELWQSADLHARQQWLRQFWDIRAALAGIPVAERIASHYRRLAHAQAQFPRRRKWGAPPGNALLLDRPDLPFDDRGLIYVRHGEPFDVIRTPNAFAPPSESWVYRDPDGGFRVLHFDNYASAERSLAAVGNPQASSGSMGAAFNEYVLIYNLPCDADWAGERAAYDRRLALLRCNEFDRRSISAEVRRDAFTALRTDSDQPAFARDLPFVFDVYTFRATGSLTDITTALALPANHTVSDTTAVRYPLDLSVILADTVAGRVARTDTTVSDAAASGATSVLHATVAVPAGNSQALRVLLRENPDALHGRIAGRTLDVPDYSGTHLMMSDVVLASLDVGGTFRRGDVSLRLVPAGEFPQGAFQVFYEIYNLAPESRYQTEVIVERRRGGIGGALRRLLGSGPIVRLRFEDVAIDEGVVRELRRVETSLGHGQYRLRVRIMDRTTGQTAERIRDFFVEELRG